MPNNVIYQKFSESNQLRAKKFYFNLTKFEKKYYKLNQDFKFKCLWLVDIYDSFFRLKCYFTYRKKEKKFKLPA